MITPITIEDYIQTHAYLEEELTQLHQILLAYGLDGDMDYGEPIYSLNDTQILGFRAYKDMFSVWFKNDLNEDELLKVPKDIKGFHLLRFRKDDELESDFIHDHISAAVKRLNAQ